MQHAIAVRSDTYVSSVWLVLTIGAPAFNTSLADVGLSIIHLSSLADAGITLAQAEGPDSSYAPVLCHSDAPGYGSSRAVPMITKLPLGPDIGVHNLATFER